MAIVDTIRSVLDPIAPYVEWIILFILPIYISIGEVFANISIAFLSFLPSNSYILAYIIMGVFIVLGIEFAVISEKKYAEE